MNDFYDIIMPLFLFIVGAVIPFSMGKRLREAPNKASLYPHLFKRFVLLFILGWIVQGNLLSLDINKKTSSDRLMVRVLKAQHDQLVFKKGSREMDFTGRVMRGFLFVESAGFDSEKDIDFWIEKALYFNREIY